MIEVSLPTMLVLLPAMGIALAALTYRLGRNNQGEQK